jgi:hypothetical protein
LVSIPELSLLRLPYLTSKGQAIFSRPPLSKESGAAAGK